MIDCGLSPSVLAADLQKAGLEIDRACGAEEQTALGFIAAVALFCATPYRGLGVYDREEFPTPFSEERLRRLYATAVGKGGNLVSSLAKRALKEQIGQGKRPAALQELAKEAVGCARELKQNGLTADLLFALCLGTLKGQEEVILHPSCRGGFSAVAAVTACGEGIEDFVIGRIEKVKEELDQKIKRARAIRDWRPALPVASGEELSALLCEYYRFECQNGVLSLRMEGFFGEEDLTVRAVRRGENYLFCDDGCALKALLKRVPAGVERRVMAKKILAGTVCQIEGEVLTAEGRGLVTFGDFLQYLILVANADLIAKDYVGDERYEEYAPLLPLVPLDDPQGLEGEIRSLTYMRYDEERGTLFYPALCFLGNQTGTRWLLTTDGKEITLRDHANSYDEGAVFEQYLTFEDELTPAFCRQIAPVLERFGGRIEGKKLVLSCKSGNMTLLCRTLYRYLQAAVLLSRFGGPIPVYRT